MSAPDNLPRIFQANIHRSFEQIVLPGLNALCFRFAPMLQPCGTRLGQQDAAQRCSGTFNRTKFSFDGRFELHHLLLWRQLYLRSC
jgi:hypothetical protein